MRLEEHLIEMPDGIRLAADLFFPDSALAARSAPAVLEYLPYRKDDSRLRDWDLFSYVVERGYVCARVDIRGTGRSKGVLPEREYSEAEQADGEVVIDWLSRQAWCNGAVGMWGISWGGFNSIHQAMRHPGAPALKAIVACMATDDLFHDDIHYIDGMMHLDEYTVMIDLLNTMAGAPDFVLDSETLASRFDQPPWLLTWLRHQRFDSFWEQGTLRPGYERLRVPSYLIGGYLDGYRDSVPRMLEHTSGVPVRGLMGPWNHSWPHDALPGPEIEWREDVVRWFDRFLKGVDNGIESEPSFVVFVRHSYPPDLALEEVPGSFLAMEGWPVSRLQSTVWVADAAHRLSTEPGTPAVHQLGYVPSAGANASMWWGELTPDQRPVDAFSLVYDTEPLDEAVTIVGFPSVSLRASVDAPMAHFFARLCDVAPDASTTLVTGGGMNGAHRDSAAHPSALEPGKEYSLDFDLHFTSWVFPAGHRIRLSISNATFPMIWPTPYPMAMSLVVGGEGATSLTLPVLPPDGRNTIDLPASPGVVQLEGYSKTGHMLPNTWTVVRDEDARSTTVRWEGHDADLYPWGSAESTERLEYEVSDDDPAHARARGGAETKVTTASGRELCWRHQLDLRSDEEFFFYDYVRQLYEAGGLVREKTWSERLRRDFQ